MGYFNFSVSDFLNIRCRLSKMAAVKHESCIQNDFIASLESTIQPLFLTSCSNFDEVKKKKNVINFQGLLV